jgi:hypothetical protein
MAKRKTQNAKRKTHGKRQTAKRKTQNAKRARDSKNIPMIHHDLRSAWYRRYTHHITTPCFVELPGVLAAAGRRSAVRFFLFVCFLYFY